MGNPVTVVMDVIAVLSGILLTVGLWTPIASVLAAAVEFWITYCRPVTHDGNPFAHNLLILLAVSLVLLGPGAWSVDSRRFGRKLYVNAPKDRASRQSL